MKIAVIGATGNLGGAVAAEASARGHDVTALGSKDVNAADPASLRDAVAGHDAVVAALKGADHLVPRAAEALLSALPEAGVDRLLFVGGGGSLTGPDGQRFVDGPNFPAAYLETARDQTAALDLLRAAETPVRWTYVSPPPMYLVPGEKTGTYRVEARDTPLLGADGESRVSVGDYASAIVDALESGNFARERVTVAY
ncbi:NAD(P)-dependent oxidoreductase [Hamadaea tsunoensis]|uniref:NAD(P)-dependent oxidoreductase n=1 Tax=Hamadaea tsunoensis TaxID=53368 RepID=UPI00040E1B92|nr:NAD(P)H-binding protein [Hamadaea tsunoensis]